MFAVWENYRNPFATILVPLERGGSRRHFESLPIEIHRRSSEISSLEFLGAGIFCSVYLWFPYVRYPPPHEEISITMFIYSQGVLGPVQLLACLDDVTKGSSGQVCESLFRATE